MKKKNSNNDAAQKEWAIPWTITGAHGFVATPVVLIRNKGRLKLDDDELCLVLAIMSHKWGDDAPWPAVSRLEDYLGWSDRKVQRTLRKLEGKTEATKDRGALLTIITRKTERKRNDTNLYDFTPLFLALSKLEVVADKNGVMATVEISDDHPRKEVAEPATTQRATATGHAEVSTPAERTPVERATAQVHVELQREEQPLPVAPKLTGFGKARYVNESIADFYEARDAEALARADQQAEEADMLEWIHEFGANALAQHELWNLPGYVRCRAAHSGVAHRLTYPQVEYSSFPRRGRNHDDPRVTTAESGMPVVGGNLLVMTSDNDTAPILTAEEIDEARALEAQRRSELLDQAAVLAILGFSPYRHLDFAALAPNVNPEFLKALREPADGTPEADGNLPK